MMQTIMERAAVDSFNVAAMLVFLLAILHTFCRRSDQPARLSAL
jgi:hypothetical protein